MRPPPNRLSRRWNVSEARPRRPTGQTPRKRVPRIRTGILRRGSAPAPSTRSASRPLNIACARPSARLAPTPDATPCSPTRPPTPTSRPSAACRTRSETPPALLPADLPRRISEGLAISGECAGLPEGRGAAEAPHGSAARRRYQDPCRRPAPAQRSNRPGHGKR